MVPMVFSDKTKTNNKSEIFIRKRQKTWCDIGKQVMSGHQRCVFVCVIDVRSCQAFTNYSNYCAFVMHYLERHLKLPRFCHAFFGKGNMLHDASGINMVDLERPNLEPVRRQSTVFFFRGVVCCCTRPSKFGLCFGRTPVLDLATLPI